VPARCVRRPRCERSVDQMVLPSRKVDVSERAPQLLGVVETDMRRSFPIEGFRRFRMHARQRGAVLLRADVPVRGLDRDAVAQRLDCLLATWGGWRAIRPLGAGACSGGSARGSPDESIAWPDSKACMRCLSSCTTGNRSPCSCS
jgi:hypothetical protein